MRQEFKRYDDYKTINLPWMNQIPEHWDIVRAKNVLVEQKELVGENSSDYKLLSLTKKGIIYRDLENAKGKFPKEFNSYKVVNKDNIIFCLFDIDETPRTVGISNYFGMITGAYDVFKSVNCNPHYIYYYYISIDNIKGLRPLYTGLRKVVKMPVFLSSKIPLPPRLEQDQIVKFLDFKVSRINKFINHKKRIIEFLKELKDAQITDTVTNGLNPNVTMKTSNINWLGDIPKHWELKFLSQVSNEQSISNKIEKNQNLLSLSYGKIVNKDINTTEGLLPASFDTYQIVDSGNIILRLTDLQNDHKSLRTGLVTQKGIITSAYTCIKPNQTILPEYLQLLLHSYDKCKVFYGMGGGLRQSIGFKDIRRLKVLLPPISEQNDIVKKCDIINKKIEKLIYDIEREISVIEDYKISLISETVTGKVDVRSVHIDEVLDNVGIEEIDFDIEPEDETENK